MIEDSELSPDWHNHKHVTHHELRVKAFDLYEEAASMNFVDTNGQDPGPWYFWFLAEYKLGIGPQPL